MLRISRSPKCNVLVTNGAGFLGAHLAAHLLANTDNRITLLDDLAGPGAADNMVWLNSQAGAGRLRLVRGNLRNWSHAREAASAADEIYHPATGTVADESRLDSHCTVTEGTWNLLKAARNSSNHPTIVCATYPCGAAASGLVADYARIHGIRAVALRLDSVTGPRQWAPDHDWIARVTYATLGGYACNLAEKPSALRNVLHVSDAVQAMLAARAYMGATAGREYTVAGGVSHLVRVGELTQLIERLCHRSATIVQLNAASSLGDPLEGSQAFRFETCWGPRRSVEETVRDVISFWHANRKKIETGRSEMVRSMVRGGDLVSRTHAA